MTGKELYEKFSAKPKRIRIVMLEDVKIISKDRNVIDGGNLIFRLNTGNTGYVHFVTKTDDGEINICITIESGRMQINHNFNIKKDKEITMFRVLD